MIYLHYRGVRCISLWPKPENREATPHVAATVSKALKASIEMKNTFPKAFEGLFRLQKLAFQGVFQAFLSFFEVRTCWRCLASASTG